MLLKGWHLGYLTVKLRDWHSEMPTVKPKESRMVMLTGFHWEWHSD